MANKTLLKLKQKVIDNLKKSLGEEEKLLIKLTRTAFKKNLSTNMGFGAQDLKSSYLELYTHLLNKYGSKLIIKPTSMDIDKMEILITVKN